MLLPSAARLPPPTVQCCGIGIGESRLQEGEQPSRGVLGLWVGECLSGVGWAGLGDCGLFGGETAGKVMGCFIVSSPFILLASLFFVFIHIFKKYLHKQKILSTIMGIRLNTFNT